MRLVRYSYPSYRSLSPAFASSSSPWSGLESEIDRLFESALGEFAGGTASTRFPVDLYEDKDNTYVRAELPGVERDAINVELVDGYLNISATRKQTAAAAGAGANAKTEQTFSLHRSVTVPDNAVQADKISAAYENGVLTVTLPKREEAKPRKVTVAVS